MLARVFFDTCLRVDRLQRQVIRLQKQHDGQVGQDKDRVMHALRQARGELARANEELAALLR